MDGLCHRESVAGSRRGDQEASHRRAGIAGRPNHLKCRNGFGNQNHRRLGAGWMGRRLRLPQLLHHLAGSRPLYGNAADALPLCIQQRHDRVSLQTARLFPAVQEGQFRGMPCAVRVAGDFLDGKILRRAGSGVRSGQRSRGWRLVPCRSGYCIGRIRVGTLGYLRRAILRYQPAGYWVHPAPKKKTWNKSRNESQTENARKHGPLLFRTHLKMSP